MILRLISLASVLAAASGQATAPEGGCLICGDGQVITNPDGIFEFPNQPTTPCDILQEAGLAGTIPLDQCPFLPGFVAVCECAPGDLPTEGPAPTDAPVPAPTDAPVPAPTDAPVPAPTDAPLTGGGSPVPCPETPADGCSVCGDGLCVTLPDAVFVFPQQPTVPCGILEDAGLSGGIPLTECGFLPGFVADLCGCASERLPDESPVFSPVAPPVAAPTDAPVPAPTDAPPTGGGGPLPCPEVPADGCSVCGDGLCVTIPDAVFMFPQQPTVPCGILEDAGLSGGIPLTECGFLPDFVMDLCGCASEILPDESPVFSPVAPPVAGPTDAPEPEPTPTPLPPRPTDVPDPTPPPPPTPPPTSPPFTSPVDPMPTNPDAGKGGMSMSMGMGMGMGSKGEGDDDDAGSDESDEGDDDGGKVDMMGMRKRRQLGRAFSRYNFANAVRGL